MSTIAELNIDITGSTAGLQSSMDQASSIVERAGKKMTSAGKALTAGVSAPLAGIAGMSLHAANALNENLGNVQSLGLTQERVEELRGTIQEMSIAVGKDTSDLGDGLYQVVSAFGDTADTATILEINAKAAAAGLATTTDAINLTSAVTKGYGDTSAEAVGKVSDLAFKTVQLGQTTFPELASSMGRVVPLGSAMGASMEELFGVMATATGVTGSAAEVSTQLRGVLQSMAAPTGDMASLIEKWGFNSGQAAIDAMGLQGVIEGIVAEAEASGQPLQKYISSIEGQTLALALAGPQADVFTDKLDAMNSSAGATDEAFQAQTEGINASGFAMKQVRQQMNVFLQNIGAALLPALSSALELIMPWTDWLVKMSEGFANLDPKMQLAIAGFVGLLIALGPILFVAGQLVTSISALAPVFTLLGAAFGSVVAPLALVAAGFGILYGFNLFGFRDMINGIATAVMDFGKSIVENWPAIKDFIDLFINMDASQEGMAAIVDALPTNLQPMADALLNVRGAADELWTAMKWIWQGEGGEVDWWWDITGAIADAFGLPEEAADAWADKLYDVGTRVSEVIEGIRGGWVMLKDAFGADIDVTTFELAGVAMQTAFGVETTRKIWSAMRALSGIWDNVKNLASSEELANLGTTFSTALSGVGEAIQGVFSGDFTLTDLQTKITTELANIQVAVTDLLASESFTGITQGFSDLFDAVGIGESLTAIQTAFSGFVETMTPYLEGPLARLKESLAGITNIDVTPITEGLAVIKETFNEIFSDEDATGAGFDLLGALGIATLQTALEGISTALDTAVIAINATIETVGSTLEFFGTTVQGVRDIVDGLLNGDWAEVITGIQTIMDGFVTYLTDQQTILTDLATKIKDEIMEFVGFTFEDIGILLGEPEWLVSLLDWTDNMTTPTWVTNLTTWEWEKPTWVTNFMEFKIPRPDWLDRLGGIADALAGALPWNKKQLGTVYSSGGLTLVGERGPEFVMMPRGARVFDNKRSMDALDGSGGTTVVIQNATIRDTGDVYRLAEEIDAMKRRRK